MLQAYSRRVKKRSNVPIRGTILGHYEGNFAELDNEERIEFEHRRRALLQEAFSSFLELAKSLTELPSKPPQIKLSSNMSFQRIPEKKGQNEIINGISKYLRPPVRLYLKDYTNNINNLNLNMQKLKDADYFHFIEKNCFIYEDVKQYLYVNPIITKFLVEVEAIPKFQFLDFKPQDTLDASLYLQGTPVSTAEPYNFLALQRRLTTLEEERNAKFLINSEKMRNLIESKQDLVQKMRDTVGGPRHNEDVRINNLTREIFELDNKMMEEMQAFDTRIRRVKELIQQKNYIEGFNYNTPHSISWAVGQVPLCDKNPEELRRFDTIFYLDFYTDGSAKINQFQRNIFESASSVYIPLVNKALVSKIDHLAPELSSFRSELYAILLALRWFHTEIKERKFIYNSFFAGVEVSEDEDLIMPRILTDNYFCIFILNKCLNRNINELLITGESFDPDEILFCENMEISMDPTLGKSKELFRSNYRGYLYDNLEIIAEIVRYRFTLEFVRGHKYNFGNSVADMFAKYARMNKQFKNFEVYEFDLND